MKRALLFALLLVPACGSPDAEALSAEKQYEMVQAHGQPDEKCAAARRVADAWLKRENRAKYNYWSITRDAECENADLRHSST